METSVLGMPRGAPVDVGDIVAGKYRIDRVLGQGAMGIVVAATHCDLDQRVALKFLLPEVTSQPELVARFTREARASVRIQSEHVARVLDVGTLENGAPYMVMEYLEGEDLAQVLARRGPLPLEDSVGYLLQACEAIAEAHVHGIVHRDLKPANLFLARRPSGRSIVKVLDFGISKTPATERDKVLTNGPTMMGSPVYMSPEQMVSSDRVDVRSDVWSLGVTLYELLSQRLPFDGNSMPELVANILQKPHESLQVARPDLPTGVSEVVDTCLQKNQDHRFSSVAGLARALAPFAPARSQQSVERIEHLLGLQVIRSEAPPPMASASRTVANLAPPLSSPSSTFSSGAALSASGLLLQGAPPSRSRALWIVAGSALITAIVCVLSFRALRSSRPSAVAVSAPEASAFSQLAAGSGSAATTNATPANPIAVEPTPNPSASNVASNTTNATNTTNPTDATPFEPPPALSGAHVHPSPAHSAATSPAHPTAAASGSASACRVVSYFDVDGNKHFREECH